MKNPNFISRFFGLRVRSAFMQGEKVLPIKWWDLYKAIALRQLKKLRKSVLYNYRTEKVADGGE